MKHKSIADDYSYKYKREDIFDMLNEARAEGYKQGQADTAKQVFKELEDNVIFIRGDNEDIGISLSSAENYFTLKKEYNIEE